MQRISNQERLRPWMGFALFAFLMVFFVFVCGPLQSNLGIVGLVLTELLFLTIAIVFCLIRKVSIKEVFPLKKITFKDVMGCLFLLAGSFPLSLLLIVITSIIFPASISEAGDLSDTLYGEMNYVLTVLVVALLPAICEEAIHRGAILSCFRGLKRDWVIVLIMGLFFGINHMSVLRFATTFALGMVLSYVVVKKNNILFSMFIHFMNNLISATAGYISSTEVAEPISQAMDSFETSTAAANMSQFLGAFLIICVASPLLIAIGTTLLNPGPRTGRKFLIAGLLSTALCISGFAITIANTTFGMLLNSTITYDVTEDDRENSTLDFTVENGRQAAVVYQIDGAEGDYTVRIDGDKGSNIINAPVPDGAVRMGIYYIDLQPDHYTVTVVAGDNAVGETPTFDIAIS